MFVTLLARTVLVATKFTAVLAPVLSTAEKYKAEYFTDPVCCLLY